MSYLSDRDGDGDGDGDSDQTSDDSLGPGMWRVDEVPVFVSPPVCFLGSTRVGIEFQGECFCLVAHNDSTPQTFAQDLEDDCGEGAREQSCDHISSPNWIVDDGWKGTYWDMSKNRSRKRLMDDEAQQMDHSHSKRTRRDDG